MDRVECRALARDHPPPTKHAPPTASERAERPRLGVSRQTVYAIETGRYDPSLPLAFKIAAVFGEPIESLFFPGEGTDEDTDDGAP